MSNDTNRPLNTVSVPGETHQWEPVDDDTIVIKSEQMSYIIAVVGLAACTILLVVSIIAVSLEDYRASNFLPLAFLAVGTLYFLRSYRRCNQVLVVDREAGIVRVKQWRPIKLDSLKGIDLEIFKKDVSSIQELVHIASVYRGKGSPLRFTQHQVNVVRKNGERENLLVTTDPFKAERSSQAIAKMLGVEHQLHHFP